MDPTAVATSTEKSRETEMGREATESLRLGFCVLDFFSIPSGFLSSEKLTQKFEKNKKIQFLCSKIKQNINFAQVPMVFCYQKFSTYCEKKLFY